YGDVERYDDQPPPGAVIGGADTGEVVGKQDKGMGLLYCLRLLEFFFNHKAVSAGKLFQCRHGKPLVFLQLPGDDHTPPPQGGKGRAFVGPVGGDHLNVDTAGVVPQDSAQGVEIGAFAVAPAAVGDNNALLVNRPN